MTIRVGIVGLGTMGAGMAQTLLKAGFGLTGYNRTPKRALPLVEMGMRHADSPTQAAAGASFVVVAVSDDAALQAVALGPSGFVEGIGADTVVVNCGTCGLGVTRAIDEAVRRRGAAYLDAPMTGSRLGAERASLTFMVGGPGSVLERARPLFSAMGKHVVHVGSEAGLGQAAKYCLNLSQAITLQGTLEAWGLAQQMGVPVQSMVELFENSAARSGVAAFKAPYLFAEDYSPHFRLDLMQKDLHLAIDEASRRRLPLPLASSVVGVYDQAAAEGLGDSDFLATAALLKKWLGARWSASK